ncbi:MAG: GH32 C-terminal domain-containing protein [Deinococcales bacterium]
MSDEALPGVPVDVGWHYRPEAGLFGDPKPIQWRGVTHVFFQNSPGDGAFEAMRWAHVASRDLLHWERLPDALVPEPGGPDAFGCWTGSVIRVGDGFQIFYTGVGEAGGRQQSVCRAFSDDLVHWRRDPRNPLVLPSSPFATGPDAAWRDPQVVVGDTGYHLLLTADLAGAPAALRGAIAHFRSTDLASWEPQGVLYYPGDVHRCECPDLIWQGDEELLLYSDFGVQLRRRGKDGRFRPADPPQLDDFRFYAAKTVLAARERRLLFAFLFGRRAPAGPPSDSSPWEWGGVMALPREVALDREGALRVWPVPELERLRRQPLTIEPHAGAGNGRWEREPDGGATLRVDGNGPDAGDVGFRLLGRLPLQAELDLEVAIDVGAARHFGLLLGCDRALTRGYALELDLDRGWLTLRRLMPETNPAELGLQRVALPTRTGDRIRLRAFLDHTVLEAFVDDRVSLSGRLYDIEASPDRWWGVLSRNGPLRLARFQGWRLSLSG